MLITEQLQATEEEMQNLYGEKLPPKYLSLINSIDANCPPSNYPCVGCGALIQCCSPYQPGFISSARFQVGDTHEITNMALL